MKLLNILLGVILLGASHSGLAQENKFRALFLYKFTEYIEWPSKGDKVVVGVIGDSDVYDELVKFAQAKDDLDVVKLSPTSETIQCDILYAPVTASKSITRFVSLINKKSVLIVCEDKESMTKGVDIGFYLENSKLRFMIDKGNLEGKNMIPSSKLLALGTII